MSEHAEKGHPIGGVIIVLILTALFVAGLSLMNAGETIGLAVAGLLFLFVGLFAVFSLGKA